MSKNENVVKINTIFELLLPFPYKELNPNKAHKHWSAKSKFVQAARREAAYECNLQEPAVRFDPKMPLVNVRIFYPPYDRYKRDLDNLGAMMKPYQDGIFDWLTQQYHDDHDDKYIISTTNILLKKNIERPDGAVFYYLFPHTYNFWGMKLGTIVGAHGIYKAYKETR